MRGKTGYLVLRGVWHQGSSKALQQCSTYSKPWRLQGRTQTHSAKRTQVTKAASCQCECTSEPQPIKLILTVITHRAHRGMVRGCTAWREWQNETGQLACMRVVCVCVWPCAASVLCELTWSCCGEACCCADSVSGCPLGQVKLCRLPALPLLKPLAVPTNPEHVHTAWQKAHLDRP